MSEEQPRKMPFVASQIINLENSIHRTHRFWGNFVALCILSFVTTLNVVIITALPRTTTHIRGFTPYVWIANSFFVASPAFQPIVSQLSNNFNDRSPLIAYLALFALGSGVGGGVHHSGKLIAGREIQGIGAGRVCVLLDTMCCNLVLLRERGKYVGSKNL